MKQRKISGENKTKFMIVSRPSEGVRNVIFYLENYINCTYKVSIMDGFF